MTSSPPRLSPSPPRATTRHLIATAFLPLLLLLPALHPCAALADGVTNAPTGTNAAAAGNGDDVSAGGAAGGTTTIPVDVSISGRKWKHLDERDLISPDQVRKGMKGYGLTVFGGNRVERFSVQVLGVLRRRGPARDLILVRASGGVLAKSGVIAGMSGSPIYIDGKLAGALAFAWAYAKEAIAGVQPIAGMLALEDMCGRDSGTSGESSAECDGKSRLLPNAGAGLSPVELGSRGLVPPSTMSPVRNPVFFDGFDGRHSRLLARLLRSHGLLPVTAGNNGSLPAATVSRCDSTAPVEPAMGNGSGGDGPRKAKSTGFGDIVPGQAVAVNLIRGDLNVSAVGTITCRQGDTIIAFGHPFMGLGDLSLPICRADVQTVLPSLYLSFKMANTLDPIGALVFDGATGVVGRLGAEADMLDSSLDMRIEGRKETKSFHFQVARQERLTPGLLGVCFANCISDQLSRIGPATLDLRLSAFIDGHGRLSFSNSLTTNMFPSGALAAGLSPVMILLGNRIEKVRVDKVKLEVDISKEFKYASIDSVRWIRDRYEPGELLRAAVIIKPDRTPLDFRTFELRLPDDLRPGKLNITVASGMDHVSVIQKRDPGRFKPKSIDQVVKLFDSYPDFKSFYVSFDYGKAGASLNGRSMPRLPASFHSIIDGTRGLRFEKLQQGFSRAYPTDWVLSGKTSFSITIVARDGGRTN